MSSLMVTNGSIVHRQSSLQSVEIDKIQMQALLIFKT